MCKVFATLLLLLFGVAFVHSSGDDLTNPEAAVIDEEAFVAKYSLSTVDVLWYIEDTIRFNQNPPCKTQIDAKGQLVTICKTCEDGPTIKIFTDEEYFYHPPPKFTTCRGLDYFTQCGNEHNCEADKMLRRTFYTIAYKQFNLWGIKYWVPIGITQLHLVDEIYCTCRPRCKSFSCFPPRYFNADTCACQCPNITCSKPYVVEASSCNCRCDKDIVCPYPQDINWITCECECRNECPPYHKPDPEKNCTCVPICKKDCPDKSYLDLETCKCVGECEKFYNEYDCNAVESCKDARSRKCKWFPTFPHEPCQCDNCHPKDGYEDYDCSSQTPFGRFTCNFFYDWKTRARPCTWASY